MYAGCTLKTPTVCQITLAAVQIVGLGGEPGQSREDTTFSSSRVKWRAGLGTNQWADDEQDNVESELTDQGSRGAAGGCYMGNLT